MVTRFTVVQYIPDPIAGERMNCGIIAWREGRIFAKFVRNWRRLRTFGGEGIDFLRDFADRVLEVVSGVMEIPGIGGERLDQEQLEKIIGRWVNSIQFSPPQSSLKAPDQVVEELAPIFLRERGPTRRRSRDRRAAAALAVRSISTGLEKRRVGLSDQFLKKNHTVQGKVDTHTFDVVLTNGKPFLAAQGLSFEVLESRTLLREVEATAWVIDDVRHSHPRLPLAVLALPPRKKTHEDIFDRARRIFADLRASVVMEDQADAWAKKIARKVPVR